MEENREMSEDGSKRSANNKNGNTEIEHEEPWENKRKTSQGMRTRLELK